MSDTKIEQMPETILRIDVGEEMAYIRVAPGNYSVVTDAFEEISPDWDEAYLTTVEPERIETAEQLKRFVEAM